MFEEKRPFEKVTGKDGQQWRQFEKEGRDAAFKLESPPPSWEEAMEIDLIRSARKDRQRLQDRKKH